MSSNLFGFYGNELAQRRKDLARLTLRYTSECHTPTRMPWKNFTLEKTILEHANVGGYYQFMKFKAKKVRKTVTSHYAGWQIENKSV